MSREVTLTPGSVAAEVAESVAAASPADLCRSFAYLTHRMHAAIDPEFEAALRAHRDTVEAEMIRRMEAGS